MGILASTDGIYKNSKIPYVVDCSQAGAPDKVSQHIEEYGFVALRNLFTPEHIEELFQETEKMMQRPSVGGSVGYYAKDCAKRICDPLLFGRKSIDVVTNSLVLDCVEEYMGGPCILSEIFAKKDLGIYDTYFPVHADFSMGMHIGNCKDLPVTPEMMQKKFAIGAMLYLHNTNAGAFCYSVGSHKLQAPFGTTLEKYPENMRAEIQANFQRIDGRAGDLVLFDDRGFHAPEQPTSATRTVFIFDYYSVKDLGRVTKSPPPLLINDLSHLDERKMKVLGLGASVHIGYFDHHTRQLSSRKSSIYSIVAWIYETCFMFMRLKRRLKNILFGQQQSFLPGSKPRTNILKRLLDLS